METAIWGQCAWCGKTERHAQLQDRSGVPVCPGCQDSADIDGVRAQLAEAKALLWQAQWTTDRDGATVCLWCDGSPESGHHPACQLAALLGEEGSGG